MTAVLTEFINLLVGGISAMASGIGSGIQELVTQVFLTTDTGGAVTGLSAFGGVIAIFGAISLAVGLSTLVVKWVMSIGARN